MVLELFVAGTYTTATQLEWTILYMIGYPKVQERCHEEIKKVVGLNRSVYYSDKNTLPFVEATLLEVHRVSSITMSLPHVSAEDISIAGYRIPKNTMVTKFLHPFIWIQNFTQTLKNSNLRDFWVKTSGM